VPFDVPLEGLFESVWWVLLGLTAFNLVLFAAIVLQREQWVVYRRLRERIATRLAPVIEELLHGDDSERMVVELRRVLAGLGPVGRPVAAWLVLDALREADAGTREAVRRVLAEVGSIEYAERGTRRRMAWRRVLACEILGTIGGADSVDVLVPRLRDRRAEVRTAAARALGELGDPAAARPLTAMFLEQNGIPIGVANDALTRLGAAGVHAFRRGLESPDVSVRVTACFAIATQAETAGTAEAVVLLERRLRMDAEPRVRAAAASAMRWVPADAAPEAMLEAVHDAAPSVRRSAAKSLAAFDDPAAAEALEPLLSDADRETALRSAESLRALSEGARAGAAARLTLSASHAWSVESVKAVAELSA
jgi:HEAT repeat protein